MNTIQIEAEVGQDHRLIDALPPEVPVGRVKLVVEPLPQPATPSPQPLTRDEARAKLLAAGKLLTSIHAPPGAVALSNEELEKLGQLAPGARSSEALLDEDRGKY
ncbi:MAG TPA: hypothetical protein VKQ72_07595 [Aggregatilineales bacterium]|nr:hypothetical protein [Aggregatilineales bacterium]